MMIMTMMMSKYDNVDDGDNNICNCGEGGDEEDVKLKNRVKIQLGGTFTF